MPIILSGQSRTSNLRTKLKLVHFRDGIILENTSAYFLLLPSVGSAEKGNYSCTAANSIGTGPSDSLHLDITGSCCFQ